MMNKKWLIGIGSALLLAGCASSGGGSTSSAPAPTPKPTPSAPKVTVETSSESVSYGPNDAGSYYVIEKKNHDDESAKPGLHAGMYNRYKVSNSTYQYVGKDTQYELDIIRNRENIENMVKKVLNFLGSTDNWMAQTEPKRNGVSWETGIPDYFIQDGTLIKNFVVSLNRSRPNGEGYFGQGGPGVDPTTYLNFPKLGDPYKLEYIEVTDATPDEWFEKGTTTLRMMAYFVYTAEGLDGPPVSTRLYFDMTNEGKIMSYKPVPAVILPGANSN